MTAQVAQDLRAAAEVLERDGWGQGSYHLRDGCHCGDGAIAVATGSHLSWEFHDETGDLIITVEGPTEAQDRWGEAFDFASLFLAPARTTSLIGWNDEPGRTADEVIAALRAAADAAEASS